MEQLIREHAANEVEFKFLNPRWITEDKPKADGRYLGVTVCYVSGRSYGWISTCICRSVSGECTESSGVKIKAVGTVLGNCNEMNLPPTSSSVNRVVTLTARCRGLSDGRSVNSPLLVFFFHNARTRHLHAPPPGEVFCLTYSVMPEPTGALAVHRWRRTEKIIIQTIHDTEIAVFPLSFIQGCSDNTWQYVLDVVNMLVVPDFERPGVIRAEDGVPVILSRPPSAGKFLFEQPGSSAWWVTTLELCIKGL